ncbi:DUF1302 domain-containing protein [Variovorax sp. J22R115]|uniref:DUF1302 domain-containing protein n=1 Tax=Variovorax sp. J22R115 TaxID=3053509 RepID=UPI002577D748|nr:DUF1302 domain-containing protein [Variovorax sp. J22R115]MDM0047421.1 DUF1302 domain-containing protein [Variovorax sp. J22R115]
MNDLKTMKHPDIRRHALSAAALVLCAGTWLSANAFEIDTGNDDLQVRWDNTVRYNLGRRVQSQDPVILKNINADDGDRNFGNNSIVNNRVDLLSEFDVVYQKKFGARVSGAGWYDNAYSGSLDNTSVATSNHLVNGQPALGLSNYTKRYYEGPSGELLDAFAFGSTDLGTMPLSFRAGRHTVNWGEALLGGGAIHGITYGQSPLDLAKSFASPGIDAKELYRPLNQISSTLQATSELSFAAQYFLQWDASRLPETGSYLGFNDALQFGGQSLLLAPGVRALRGPDLTPKNSGDWGVMSHWSPQWLDGTMGVYVRNFSDKLPQIVVKATGPRQYFETYGDDVDMYGVSLSKQLWGVSFGADLNYRRNMPLNSDVVQITSLAQLPAAGDLLGARGDTVHGVLNAIGSVPSTPLFNSASWSGELTWNRWTSVTQGAQYFKGRDSYTAIDKVSKDYFGLALNFAPTWYQVFPGADLSMPLSYSVGLSGNSAVASGGNKNAGSFAVGLGLDLYSKYRFDLKYIGYFGDYTLNTAGAIAVANGSQTYLRDRGAIFLTFKTTL